MKHQKSILLSVALALIGTAAATLHHLKANQKLGRPGIVTKPIPGSQRLQIYLPAQVLNYDSTNIPTDQAVLQGLPQDTSFAQRVYSSREDPDDRLALNVVLMGTDRTSIHKPQFCLVGEGWNIDNSISTPATVAMEDPHPYDLPVMKLLTKREILVEGKVIPWNGIYAYWFVADKQLTASHGDRMWRMGKELLQTGVLERWAYISCFATCAPGAEEATWQRMQKFIRASVPQFQLVPPPQKPGSSFTNTALNQFQ